MTLTLSGMEGAAAINTPTANPNTLQPIKISIDGTITWGTVINDSTITSGDYVITLKDVGDPALHITGDIGHILYPVSTGD